MSFLYQIYVKVLWVLYYGSNFVLPHNCFHFRAHVLSHLLVGVAS